MTGSDQGCSCRRRWTVHGKGASLDSQRAEFEKALRGNGTEKNDGLSTVYAYLRDKDSPSGKAGSPYYIGVAGSTSRPYRDHGRVPVPAERSRIRILRSGLTHAQARAWEKHYIKVFGRKDIRSGRKMLLNRTDGGEGLAGGKLSASARLKISAAAKGKKKSVEHRANLSAAGKGKKHAREVYVKGKATKLEKTALEIGVDPALYASLTEQERNTVRKRFYRGKRGDELFGGDPYSARLIKTAVRYGLEPSAYSSLAEKERNLVRSRYREGKRGSDLLKGLR